MGRVARVRWFLLVTCHVSLVTCHGVAHAAISESEKYKLEAAALGQGGGDFSSESVRQIATIGEAVSSAPVSSTSFDAVPGFIGALLSIGGEVVPVAEELDIATLYAKPSAGSAAQISEDTWQMDPDPAFFWEPPAADELLAGYSYAFDADPDETVDLTPLECTDTLCALEMEDLIDAGSMTAWADGQHLFNVQALNTAGTAGAVASLGVWVDTTAPVIGSLSPSEGSLLNAAPTISASVTDAHSGVAIEGIMLTVNGGSASVTYDPATGTLTATSGAWKEGVNTLSLSASDQSQDVEHPSAGGNAPEEAETWTVTLDTKPPTPGALRINGGAEGTTSIYVTLSVSASDPIPGSGVSRLLISNEADSGYVEEPYVTVRPLWKLKALSGTQTVFVKFRDKAGNLSAPVSAEITVSLLAPETLITSGPAGVTASQSGTFSFMCPEGGCVFSWAFDAEDWSDWSGEASVTKAGLTYGNHYFKVRAAKDSNGVTGVQDDEVDPSPAQRMWIVWVGPTTLPIPTGPAVKLWRLE